MALDLFLKGSNRPVIRGTLKDISDALWEVQESINTGSFGIDAASVPFDPTSTDMSATDVDAAIKANWTDIRNIDIDGNTRTILIRADTAANLASADAVLAEFELVYESDTGLSKLGDGATAYTLLPYTNTGSLQLFPEPGLIDSDGSGAWSPDYDTEIDGYGIVTFARATGDVTAGPLELKWPAMPVGATHNIRFEEAATITAATRMFTLNCNWSDGAGVGVLEIDEGTKTWDDFAPAVGDTISGGPFGTPTTIAALISTTVIHTTTLPGETGSGDINLTAPADSIQGVRTIATPAMDDSGVIMVLTRRTASTATSRGAIDTGERISSFQDDIDALQAQINELDGLSSISAQILTPSSASNEYTLLAGDQVLALDTGDLQFNVGVIAENTDNPATALTQYLPTGATNGASFNIIREKGQTGQVTLRGADYALVLTPTATNGSPTLTGLTEAETAPIAIGDAITGALVPGSTTILSKTTTTITMSGNATGSGATSVTVTVREAVFGLDPANAARNLVLPMPGPNSEAIITSVLCRRATTTGPFVPACWYTVERENGGSLTIPVELGTSISSPSISFSGTLDAELHNGRQINATNDITIPVTDGLKVLIYATTSLDVNAGGAAVAMVEGDMIYVFVVGSEVRYTPVLATSEMATS